MHWEIHLSFLQSHNASNLWYFAIRNKPNGQYAPPPKKNKFLPVGQESDNYLFRQNFCPQPGTPLHLYPAPQVKQLLWRMLYMYSGREKCNINMPQDISKTPHQSTPTCSTSRNFLGRWCTLKDGIDVKCAVSVWPGEVQYQFSMRRALHSSKPNHSLPKIRIPSASSISTCVSF